MNRRKKLFSKLMSFLLAVLMTVQSIGILPVYGLEDNYGLILEEQENRDEENEEQEEWEEQEEPEEEEETEGNSLNNDDAEQGEEISESDEEEETGEPELEMPELKAAYRNFVLETEGMSGEAVALAGSDGTYTSLTDEEKEILLMEVSVREDTMTELGRNGYSIRESIPKARLMQMLNINSKEVLKLIENQNGEGNALAEAVRLRDMIAQTPILMADESVLGNLLVEGYTSDDLTSAIIMSYLLNGEIEDIISKQSYRIQELMIPEFAIEPMELLEDETEEEFTEGFEESEKGLEESQEELSEEEKQEEKEGGDDDEKIEEGIENDAETEPEYNIFPGVGNSSSFTDFKEIDFDAEGHDFEEEDEADTIGEDEIQEEETGEEKTDSLENLESAENREGYEEIADEDTFERAPFKLTNGDVNEILKVSKEYKVDAQMLLDLSVEYEIEPEVFRMLYAEVQSVLGLYRSTDIRPASASNVEDITRSRASAPFDFESNHSEIINLNTGSVIYTEPIVSLAGRGGLDLNLSLIYDSNESSDDFYYGAAYRPIRVAFGPGGETWQEEFRINLSERGKLNFEKFGARYIAAGWKLNTTRIEFSENFNKSIMYLKLEDGGSYYIEDDLSLKNYELKDLELSRDTYATYEASYYKVEYANGITEYLNINGSIVAKKDKYGNVITYVDKSNKKTDIEITDTMGRKVTITGAGTSSGGDITVTLPDGSKIVYETKSASMFNGGQYRQLTKKTDQLGNETKFTYEIGEGEFDFFHHKPLPRYLFDKGVYQRLVKMALAPSTDQWLETFPFRIYSYNREVAMVYEDYIDYMLNYNGHAEDYTDINKVNYHLLKTVTYSTGTKTCFSYKPMMGKSGIGYVEYFAIDSRWDELPGENGKFNSKSFAYGPLKGSNRTHTNYTGYVLGEEVTELPVTYTYQVYEEQLGLGYKEYIYNYKHLKIEENFTGNNGYVSKIKYTYNSYNLPTRIEKTVTSGGKTMVITELYEYDQYGNVTYQWDSQAEGSKNNEFRTSYTYDGAYQMLTGKTYKTDKSTTIREEYMLTSNGRSVQSHRIYENNVLTGRTDYTYDSYGNVLTAKNYINSSKHILQTTTYDKGVYPVSTTQDNVTIKYTYDIMGNVKTATDGNGNIKSFTYDKKNREISVVYADGSNVISKYDDKNNIVTITDVLGYKTEYQYNGYGLISKILIPGTNKVLSSYKYGAYGELLSETDADNNTTTYKYDSLLRLISETKGSAVKTIEYTDVYNSSTSKVTTTAKGSGNAPDIKTSVYINKYGFTTAESGYLGSTEIKKTYEYDYIGRLISEVNPQHGKEGLKFTNQYFYDAFGNIIKSVNALNYATEYEYDWLGRQTKVTDPKGNTFTYVYDSLGNVLEERKPFENGYDSVKKYTYDKNNNLLSETSYVNKPGEAEKSVTVKYQYNNRNWLIKAENNGIYTSYEYDKAGNMLKLITGNGEQVTTYEYDRFGNIILITDAEGNSEKYEYDLKNNLIQKIDRNGNIIKHTYDIFGRLTKTEGQTPTGKAAEYMRFTYSANGMVLTEENESLKTAYTYDSLGRTTKSEDSRGTEKSYGYDQNNNRISQSILINGTTIYKADYEYDRLDRMIKLLKDGKAEAVYTYDANGNRASLTYGNGTQTIYTYNKANLIKELVNCSDGKVLSSYGYTYYLDGNQASKSDHEGRSTTYVYDDLNRLLSESEILGEGSIVKSYEYDEAGNRALMTVDENGEITRTTYTYDKTNRLLKEERREAGTLNQVINTYVYDGNGNQTMKLVSAIKVNNSISTPRLRIQLLTDDGTMEGKYSYLEPELRGSYKDISSAEQPSLGISLLDNFVSTESKTEIYTYDVFNRMRKVQMPGVKAEYTYKSDGLRISKNVNGDITNHIWDGLHLLADSNGDDFNAYYRGINLVYSENEGYYIYNAHSDVVQLADKEGKLVKEYHYDAFGVEKDIDEADENPFRYCGEYYDKETGTIYLRARYYVPSTGRFMSEDSIRDGLNWYTYGNGNPIFFIDPLGLAVEKLTDWLNSFNSKGFYNNVIWDASSKTATVYFGTGVADIIKYGDRVVRVQYTVGVEGTYIGKDGKMYVETTNKNSSSKAIWNCIDPGLEYDPVKDTGYMAAAIVAAAKGGPVAADIVKNTYMAITTQTISGITSQQVISALDKATQDSNKVNHIMQSKHAWDLVGANNWNQVQAILNNIISTGSSYLDPSGNTFYTGEYNGEIIEVSTRLVDGTLRIVDAWVKTR